MELLVPVELFSDVVIVALLVSRVDVDVELLAPVAVLIVELLVPVALLSDVLFAALLVSRMDVDVELLVPVAVRSVELRVPVVLFSGVVLATRLHHGWMSTSSCWSRSWCSAWNSSRCLSH